MPEETTSTNNPPSGGNSKKSSGSGLTKKVGPLPLWGWGAAAFAVGVAYFLLRKKNSGTTNSSAGNANASPAFAAIPASGGSGFYYNGTYPVSGTDGTTSTDPTSGASASSHPYALVADIQDLEQALDSGIPKDWLAYVGSDPNESKASQDPTYAPPQGLPSASTLPADAPKAYFGVANKLANGNAVKVYGATRKGTAMAAQKWIQAYQQYGQNVGFYIPQ